MTDVRPGRRLGIWGAAAAALTLTGCGAAYFGTAFGIIASQKDKKVTDTSFADSVPTDDAVAPFATLVLSADEETIERDLSTFDPSGSNQTGMASLTDFEVLGIDFPPGYGTARSNRDAGETLQAGDRLVVRINGDVAKAIAFDASDVASVGTQVAARLQVRVRSLTPSDSAVPLEAYTNFRASFDETTGSYEFRSGAPGEASAVVFEPLPDLLSADDEPDAASAATAQRLGLGLASGGIEVSGGESVRVTVLNRGTDVVPEGTKINLYLSTDKVLDTRLDVLFDRMTIDRTILVGDAIRYSRRNGEVPPLRLLRQDLPPGQYYVIFDVEPSGGETVLDNNVLVSSRPIELCDPVDDPATAPAETAAPLDLVLVEAVAPVSVVTGSVLTTVATLTNVGAPTPAVPTQLDLVLSSDADFDDPAHFADPAGALPGVRVNPFDPTVAARVVITQSSGAPIAATVVGSEVRVAYQSGTGVTVQDLIDVLNVSPASNLVRAAADEVVGDPSATSLDALLTAAATLEVIARDFFVTTRAVTFAAAPEPLVEQTFVVEGTIAANAVRSSALPAKLFSMLRLRPTLVPPPASPENDKNNVRRARNFIRVYDRATATFDPVTGTTLPTVNSDDFAALDAVTLRPVNTGSIRQGQQRVFRFEVPDTGATVDESQLLVILRASGFDARMDLLSSSGAFLMGVDDSGLDADPVIYTPVQASAQNRSFYVVISTARLDEGDLSGGSDTFELTISVNPRQAADTGLVNAVDAGNLLRQEKVRYADPPTEIENQVLIPYSLANGKAEVSFVLPQRARVRFGSRPVATVGVQAVITQFSAGIVPAPVSQQTALDQAQTGVVYRPTGATIDTSHELEAGVYTVAFETSGGAPDDQPFRLEILAQFLPPE